MKRMNFLVLGWMGLVGVGVLVMALVGCGATSGGTEGAMVGAGAAGGGRPTIRINAGADSALKDSQGVMWSADTGFEGGITNDRTELEITGTSTPEIYQSERYLMDYYTVKVPNGSYVLRLHFSEDFDGITEPNMRIFTYAVKDGDAATGKMIKEVKDFSPWKAAGAQYKAYVDTVEVNVTSGRITITFTAQVENPQINGIEVIPR